MPLPNPLTKEQKAVFSEYINDPLRVTQAVVIRRLELKSHNNFYRLFHHHIMNPKIAYERQPKRRKISRHDISSQEAEERGVPIIQIQ